MATLALGAIGAALGGAALPGISLLGATLSGAAIGQAAGGLLGAAIDQALFGASGQSSQVEGPRLSSLQVLASTEGAAMPRLYGTARLGGQMIWATELEEEAFAADTASSGKGLGGGEGTGRTDYRYFANFAVGLCEGPVTRIGRVWADGKELDLSGVTWRLHPGDAGQLPDSLMEAKEGAGNAPAYRGLAYIVFERLALERFGNRIPQLSFEVVKPVAGFEQRVAAISIIPGAGEFTYQPTPVTRETGLGGTAAENVHAFGGVSDWSVAIDQMQSSLPNLARATLVVSWFGDDLRVGNCTIRPKVDSAAKITSPVSWGVAGLTRGTAALVSQSDGKPAYGGSPSDASVLAAIADLKARGLGVTLSPFVLMDIPAGNGLPDPYGGAAQAPYPWRGRIALHPAAGQSGTVDKTTAAVAQLASFMGSATPAQFSIATGQVVYSGPLEWSYRRLVLHYAHLAKLAGGVESFLIGSELRGLTTARSATATYPFVTALMALAADVKAVLGAGCTVTYAADWSEYFGHQPADGTGDVHFHLDPLWASPAIDAVGIDAYWPLADWRDGRDHLDALAGAPSTYDLDYLKGNLFAGEGYAWYYASDAKRLAQVRTPITDGAGKPWVFRFKDIRSWWATAHVNRPGGIEAGVATAWVPQSKPFWLTELGCPAVERGANQPNVFVDAKSAESALPYYSSGARDDLMQRRYLQAVLEAFDPAHPDFQAASNPLSSVYGGRMLDPSRITPYTWDARPWPAFPYATDVWADGVNWQRGHWLNGRLGGGDLAAIVGAILDDHGFSAHAAAGLDGVLQGYVIDRVMSARSALQPLELAYFFDSHESDGLIKFAHRGGAPAITTLVRDDLVETSAGAELFRLTRRQETELPAAAKYTFIDASNDYAQGTAQAQRLAVRSARVAVAELPIVITPEAAARLAEAGLHDAWAARTRASLTLPPSRLAIEPGDVLALSDAGIDRLLRVTGLTEGTARALDLQSIEPDGFAGIPAITRQSSISLPEVFGPALAAFLDLPLLSDSDAAADLRFAATQSPWPGGVAVLRSAAATDYTLQALASLPATIGVTTAPLAAGVTGRWDRGGALDVMLARGALLSASVTALLAGANLAAVETATGVWELLQFRDVALTGAGAYRLSRLLRGQGGTDGAMVGSLPAGARFVLIDGSLTRLPLSRDDLGLPLNWRFGPANKPYTDATYRIERHSFIGVAQRPYSPVRIRARRVGGDVLVSWVRRTRIGGDTWLPADVPLGETSEAWRIDVMDGATVKRSLSAATTSVAYTAAEQIADWGATPATVTIRIAQISLLYGPGTPGLATV